MNREPDEALAGLINDTVNSERAKALGRPVRGKDVVLVIDDQRVVDCRSERLREFFESGEVVVPGGTELRERDLLTELTSSEPIRHSGMNRAQRRAAKK